MDTVSRSQAAYAKYFASNPRAAAEIESVSAKMLEACGITREAYCEQQRHIIFKEAAAAQGLEVDEFVISLMAESSDQAHQWRLEGKRRIAQVLGIPWDEYKQQNRITE